MLCLVYSIKTTIVSKILKDNILWDEYTKFQVPNGSSRKLTLKTHFYQTYNFFFSPFPEHFHPML
jgi:hypothetical protein